MSQKLNENVRVVVRCRPMSGKERVCGYFNIVEVIQANNTIKIFNPKTNECEGRTFLFDAVYDYNASQQEIYTRSVQPVIESVLEGFNGTIFVYGQTGTGKTYTMEGDRLDPSHKGVIPNTFDQIYNHITQSNNLQYLVRASYVEIYQEEVKDLLSEGRDKSYELIGDGSGIQIKGLESKICKNAKEMLAALEYGKKKRKVGATRMNEQSSRSHAIFIITIEMCKTTSYGGKHIKVGKLNLVDLAGSERQTKSCTSGDRLKEASKINLSLSVLGNVVSALSSSRKSHVPYRDSKLTRLLQDSLGGNSKTLMIANIGPASYNYEESLTTLRYANRVKTIKNKPIINEDPKDALIRQYQEDIERLKTLLQAKLAKNENPKLSTRVPKIDVRSNNTVDTTFTNSPSFDLSVSSLSDDEKLLIQTEQQHRCLIEKKAHLIELLMRQIHSMQSKLLQGTNIENHTKKQEEILKKRSEELKATTLRKMKLELKLEKEEETTEGLHDSHTSLTRDIGNNINKLHKLAFKIQYVKDQTKKEIEEFNSDRNDLELLQKQLIKDFKLNQMLIDNFIPAYSRKRFMTQAYYDEASERWKINFRKDNNVLQLANITRDGNCLEKDLILRNIKNCSKVRNRNAVSLPLEPPIRTVRQYISPSVPSVLKCALQDALTKMEKEITLDAKDKVNTNGYTATSTGNFPCKLRKKNVVYPKVRGFVKKK